MNTLIRRAMFATAIALSAISLAQAAGAKHAPTQARGYLIANYDIHDQPTYQKYLDAAVALAPKFKAKVIVYNMKSTGVEGSPKAATVIAEFPTLADAQRFYYSPEYTEVKKMRIASTDGIVVLSEGVAPPQK